MILITGGAGFIGNNLIRRLNSQGISDIIIVDHLTSANQFKNLIGCKYADYIDKTEFLDLIERNAFSQFEIVFHQGACTDTLQDNANMMINNNFNYSKKLLLYCNRIKSPFVYASSAAVYGMSKEFSLREENEIPLNVYGFSKLMLDNFVRTQFKDFVIPVIGLRYFNVFGPFERHKGKMASVILQFYDQVKKDGLIRLFEGAHGYKAGEQRRDFIYVDDVVDVNLFFFETPSSGIYNLGTGRSHSFNFVAERVIQEVGTGEISYVPFPENLLQKYQSFTCSDNNSLMLAGYEKKFTDISVAIKKYIQFLQTDSRNLEV